MSMIVWIVLGLILSKIVSTTGEGTVVDILLGIVGAVLGGWLFNLFGGTGVTGFNIDSVYSAGIAAIILLALYHAFFRRRMSPTIAQNPTFRNLFRTLLLGDIH